MKQLSLFNVLGLPSPEDALRERIGNGKKICIDLFTGCGGFSTGAVAAGYEVILAVDACPKALETHRRNHPRTVHLCAELPCADLPLPPPGTPFHLHGSPPCQKFSVVNRKGRSEGDKEEAGNLVEWYLELAMSSRAASWSMEQVAAKEVLDMVERVRRKHPKRVAYGVFRFHTLGVPQTRRRLIAGSPSIIAKLQRLALERRQRAIRDVIPRPRGTHIRGTCTGVKPTLRKNRQEGEPKFEYEKLGWDGMLRSLDQPAPTVVGRHALTWVTGDGKGSAHTVLHPHELAALQTFPVGYRFPQKMYDAYLQIGNAIPPLVAQLMLSGDDSDGNGARAPESPSLRRPPPALVFA